MGLDIWCNECGSRVTLFKGSYVAYHNFRRALAALYGHVFDADSPTAVQDAMRMAEGHPLLSKFCGHSDTDGKWTAAECADFVPLFEDAAARLSGTEGLYPTTFTRMPDGSITATKGAMKLSWKAMAQNFLDGLRHCARHQHAALYS
jgi:hypothetical protein